ncbi:hypothetical protein [Candidatus Azobacteroides pseudotrichonymphae]|uniref:hypothetical protein n=1 Tax=Candidatus Azobacteroides pseudotrichonymphae TaxID=511435 RepID=UPI0002EB5733|nr:hypothetical protein [Candidatus Azobacteroides pseudotrichonymphae]
MKKIARKIEDGKVKKTLSLQPVGKDFWLFIYWDIGSDRERLPCISCVLYGFFDKKTPVRVAAEREQGY